MKITVGAIDNRGGHQQGRAMTSILIAEILMRAAAAGVQLLLAAHFLFGSAPKMRRWLGALFVWSAAVYTLISGQQVIDVLGPLENGVIVFAVFGSVFFWWFALSLFDDEFRWTWKKLVPFGLLLLLHGLSLVWSPLGNESAIKVVMHNMVSISLMAHIVWIALHDLPDDLVDPRRRFRVFLGVAIGISGVLMGLGEVLANIIGVAEGVTLIHALILMVLAFSFAFWLLTPNHALLGVEVQSKKGRISPEEEKRAQPVSAADMSTFQKLTRLMDDGVYREEGLTVAVLAGRVGVPEHQLRRLINRELGFRNFSAFLNARRLEDAKSLLAAPENARRQILQIALDLGYGSIAPFNRAFKEATGQTPTEFRKEKLG